MKKLLLTLLMLGSMLGPGWAQCTGVFPANTLCGNLTGSPGVPSAFAASTITGPGPTTVGDIAVWNNTTGTILKDVPPLQIYGTIGNNLFMAGPSTGGPLFPTFRAITAADISSALANTTMPTTQSLTSGTGATYTTPAGARWIEVFMVGGGGGGAGSSATTLTVGSAGGTSTFNAINAAGGGAATNSPVYGGVAGAGGTGGTGTATRRQPGGPGQNGVTVNVTPFLSSGGMGGSSYFGGGAIGTSTAGSAAGNNAAANTGAGGSGAANNTAPVASGGGGGGEFVYLIINAPAATYTYTIGTSGAGGVSGQNGGNGGTGFIFVIEHYAP